MERKNKFLIIVLLAILVLALVGCGGKKGATANSGNTNAPIASQNTTPVEIANSPSNKDDGTIAVKSVTGGYEGGLGKAFIRIDFARGSANGKLMEVRNVGAEEAGFSTTSNFKLLDISATRSGVTVYFDGTEANNGDFNNITYTKPSNPVLKDIDGTPVESFSHPRPYHNFDLYD
jgi:predicted small lipoprotein YifL